MVEINKEGEKYNTEISKREELGIDGYEESRVIEQGEELSRLSRKNRTTKKRGLFKSKSRYGELRAYDDKVQEYEDSVLIEELEKKSIPELIILSVVAFMSMVILVGRLFIFTPYQVTGTSMSPTLADGDKVIVKEEKEYNRGDIIVFKSPNAEDTDYVKRVVGIGGDTIRIKDSKVTVNDKDVYNDEEFGETYTYKEDEEVETYVPEGHLYVLGDNRGNSMDSRIFGTIKTSIVKGKLSCKVYPFEDVKCKV